MTLTRARVLPRRSEGRSLWTACTCAERAVARFLHFAEEGLGPTVRHGVSLGGQLQALEAAKLADAVVMGHSHVFIYVLGDKA